jgi:hypothetical protein
MATAVFVLMEIQFLPRTVTLATGMAVAVIGAVFFGMRSRGILWVFPAAMLATALWANDPGFTVLSVTAIVVPVILAGVVVAVSDPARFMGTLAVWTRIALLLSFVVFVLRPDLGAQNDSLYDGAMRGLFAHKNGLARLLVVGVFAELFAPQPMRRRALWLAMFLVAAYLTRSTSFFALVAVILVGVVYVRLVTSRNQGVAAAAVGLTPLIVVLVGAGALLYGPDLIEDSGRFSGEGDRGRIWFGASTLFEMRPAGGWGYGQVFRPDTEAGQHLYSIIGWVPTAAHSGYMNALSEGGWLGILALASTLLAAIAITWRGRSAIIWPFVWAVALTLNNLTDTRITSIEWFLLAAGVLYASGRHVGTESVAGESNPARHTISRPAPRPAQRTEPSPSRRRS